MGENKSNVKTEDRLGIKDRSESGDARRWEEIKQMMHQEKLIIRRRHLMNSQNRMLTKIKLLKYAEIEKLEGKIGIEELAFILCQVYDPKNCKKQCQKAV